jgi:DNA-binding MarR family transcriptional regulator
MTRLPPVPDPAAHDLCEPASGPGWRLWHAQRAWVRHLEAALAPLGLTHTQLLVLAAAGWLGREALSQARIAEHVGIDRMTASRVLRLLEAKGHVARAPHPDDPRANGVALTRAGADALARALPLARRAQRTFFGRLGPEGQRALDAQLVRLLGPESRP